MICPECYAKNPDSNSKCFQCGVVLPEKDEFDSRPGTMSGMKTTIGTENIENSLKTGTLFAGRYEILNDGFKGGMGIVYKVKDNTLGKIKALKFILPAYLENEKAVSRFKQEVAITQELQHENIVRVYDIGESEALLYFTMEWIDGISLRDYINERKKQNNRFSFDEVKYLIGQICSALNYAHKSIIHRDIKPENILVIDPYSKTPKLKITDFGIAKTESQSIHHSVSAYMGTPIYMAPEQYTDAAHADKRADIYSVGVILYELLTFLHPLGTFPMPTEVNPSLPKNVDGIIKKALSAERTKRYDDAMDIVKELEAPIIVIDEKPVEKPLRSPTSQQEDDKLGKKPSKKNPIMLIAVAGGIILVIAGFFYYSNINKSIMEQIQKDLTHREEKIKEEVRKAELAAKKAEMERQREEDDRRRLEIARLKAEEDKANAVKSVPSSKQPGEQLTNRDEIDKYLAEGKSLFEKGKYRESSEVMNKVLQKNPNNSTAKWYIREASKKIEESKNLSKRSPNGRY